MSPGSRWGRASEDFGEDTYLTSIAGRNHGESDAGQKSSGSLLGDDQRETFCAAYMAPLRRR